ncbi:MAG: SDR family oxidoreductase [Spirochaetaceae bacterium]|nr:SDR family oxidoreductase [Spirochaetaceae bacterium]
MDLGTSGKVYLTAAATSGLGKGVARELAADGASVWIGSRDTDAVQRVANEMASETGGRVGGAALDVTEPSSISSWVSSALSEHQRIDGLLVNAGGPPAGGFESFTDPDWQMAFELTLMSTIRLIREVLPTMKRQKAGSILVITSSSIKEPIDILLLSNVMRSGVANLVKSLSREFAPFGIRVNSIIPGRIATPRVRALDETVAGRAGKTPDEIRRESEASIPLGRYGTTDEFGRVGAFILSPAASYMTGEMVTVDGGAMRGVW